MTDLFSAVWPVLWMTLAGLLVCVSLYFSVAVCLRLARRYHLGKQFREEYPTSLTLRSKYAVWKTARHTTGRSAAFGPLRARKKLRPVVPLQTRKGIGRVGTE